MTKPLNELLDEECSTMFTAFKSEEAMDEFKAVLKYKLTQAITEYVEEVIPEPDTRQYRVKTTQRYVDGWNDCIKEMRARAKERIGNQVNSSASEAKMVRDNHYQKIDGPLSTFK